MSCLKRRVTVMYLFFSFCFLCLNVPRTKRFGFPCRNMPICHWYTVSCKSGLTFVNKILYGGWATLATITRVPGKRQRQTSAIMQSAMNSKRIETRRRPIQNHFLRPGSRMTPRSDLLPIIRYLN